MTRELDAAVAEVRGWTIIRYDDGGISAKISADDRYVSHLIYCPSDPGVATWNPSEDIKASWQMEGWIVQRGLQARYAQAMMAEFLRTDDPVPDTDEQLWWMLLHATPEQRCMAFLAAMGVEVAESTHS